MATDTICVLHSLPRWLPRTATWLHNQLRYLPESVCNHIACESTENLAEFSIENLHCLDSRTKPSLWEGRLYRKLRLGFLLERPYVKHLVDVATRHGAQILHSHWGDWACRVAPAAQLLGIPHVVTFYGKDVNFFP